jgi:hypothetical protein
MNPGERARISSDPEPGRTSAYARIVGHEASDATPAAFPGAEFVRSGIEDLARGTESIGSLLVSIGAPRLTRLGLRVASPIASPEHRLYALLAAEDADAAHARYNALVRRLVSFERAAECAS